MHKPLAAGFARRKAIDKTISAERRDELIQEIIESILLPNASDRTAPEKSVHEAVSRFEQVAPDYLTKGAIKKRQTAAAKLVQTINALQGQIRNAPPELRSYLKLDGDGIIPTPDGWRGVPNDYEAKLFATFDDLKRGATAAAKNDRSEHDLNRDTLQKWCASMAFHLIAKHTVQVPTNGSNKAPSRSTRGLAAF